MSHLVSKLARIFTALIITVFSINLLTVMDVYATDHATVTGNNGTLKVHEQGTASGTESNDPKVCAFNLEGFGFDEDQEGYIIVSPKNTDIVAATLSFGPADAAGFAASAYVNDGISGYNIPNGQYEATLYGKDTGSSNQPDQKAKSKVFKVDCAITTPTAATPTVTVQAGACVFMGMAMGTASGSVTNTDDATDQSVTYTITATHQTTSAQQTTTVTLADGATGNFSFSNLAAGTYDLTVVGSDQTTAAAVTFTIAGCVIIPPTPVTPAAPTHIDTCGKKNDSYTIPTTVGVTYLVNGNAVAAGTYTKAKGTVIITAQAQPGYVIDQAATQSWTITFSNKSCKVTICHRTASYTNPYNKIRVSLKAVDGVGKGDHYKQHQGPIFDPSLPLHTEWGDIIPPTAAQPTGLNWTTEGQAIWAMDDCEVTLVEATPTTPTFSDVCDTQNDTYTIPSTTGVSYFVNGSATATAAGTYAAQGTVTITAVAKDGYILGQAAQTTWSHSFDTQACPKAVITATTECTMTGATVYLKNTGDADGYAYVNGGLVLVPAKSQVEKAISLLDFKSEVVVTTGDETTILDTAIDCTPGRGSIGQDTTPTPTATPQTSAIPQELPMTGPSSLLSQMITMIMLAIATYGITYYLQGRRQLNQDR